MARTQRRDLGKAPNEGARLLWLKLLELGWSGYRLGREMGLAPGAPVYRWLYCDQKPDPQQRTWMHDRLEIDFRTWDQEPTGDVLPPDPPEDPDSETAGAA